jgi:clan AA aspartic protease (TIGR02281 family)
MIAIILLTSVAIFARTPKHGVDVDVQLGKETVRMMVDTGASTLQITAEIATRLLTTMQAKRTASIVARMADGHTSSMPSIVINEVKVGAYALHNIQALVTEDGGMMLLPFTILDSIGPFKIDTRAKLLVFDDAVAVTIKPPPFNWSRVPLPPQQSANK